MPSDEFAYRVARLVASRRTQQDLTLEALASRAGLHRTTLGLVERGERRLSLDSAKRLADALGVSLWELVREAEAAEPPQPAR